tara:strand:- start:736 stop:1173 length:438 start_codon:yes stop_codon:yes gene_type:complete
MAEETKTEEAAGDTKPKGGVRKALIDKVDLVDLIWDNAKFDDRGKAEGFPAIMAELLALKSFRDGNKSEKYVKRYLENRIRKMMGESIPLPVFTDVPEYEKPKSKRQLAIEKAQARMLAAGVSAKVIARNSDIHLGIERRKSDKG